MDTKYCHTSDDYSLYECYTTDDGYIFMDGAQLSSFFFPYPVEYRINVDGIPYAKIEELELTLVSSPLYINKEFLIVYDMSEFELTLAG